MTDLEVRIVRLDAMFIGSVRAIGESPERDAWSRLYDWAAPKGLIHDLENHPVFGFNNPNPSPGRNEYGYEFWIKVEPQTVGAGEVEIKEFPGGLYAVTRCRLVGDPSGPMPVVWKKLWDWLHASDRYAWRKTHELERLLNPLAVESDVILDLYLPVEEKGSRDH